MSKAFRVFNKRNLVVEESIHVVFDESRSQKNHPIEEDDENLLEYKLEKKLDDLSLNEKNLEENVVNDISRGHLVTPTGSPW